MSRIWIAVLALLVCGGFASAERPQCQWDSEGNLVLTQGACFYEWEGTVMVGMTSPNADQVWAVFTGKQDWLRFGSEGSGQYHLVDQPAKVVYCSPSIVAINHCWPQYDNELYIGTGKFSVNAFLPNMCPASWTIVGNVTSSKGEPFKISAVEVDVKDKTASSGCRTLLSDISLKAK